MNSSISTGTFTDELEIAGIVPAFKNENKNDKLTIDQLAFCL